MMCFSSNRRHSSQSGFTLVEMMIVVSVMAVIAAMAFPSIQRQIASANIISATGNIESVLKEARANALIQKRNVTVALSGRTLTVSDGSTTLSTLTLPSKISITQENSMPASITFTHLKTVSTGLSADAGFGVCYQGVSTDKKVVRVDRMANITIVTSGSCS